MSSKLRFTIVLSSICAISGIGVAGIYMLTRDRIHEQQEKVKEEALPVVLPEASGFVEAAVKCPEHGKWIGLTPENRSRGEVKCPWGGETLNLEDLPEDADIIYAGYAGTDVEAQPVGYACIGEAQGYSSRLKVMVGVSVDFSRITGIKIVFQKETPGLGARIEELATKETLWDKLQGKGPRLAPEQARPWFQQQFTDLAVERIKLKKTEEEEGIDGITGATITSQAVVDAVKEAVKKISEALGAEDP